MKAQLKLDREAQREIYIEAMRRAVWDATKGPMWLRDGRYDPKPPPENDAERPAPAAKPNGATADGASAAEDKTSG